MLKYVNGGVVFQEIPDEVTLSINISNCPCHCPSCHSQYLWKDIGEQFSITSPSGRFASSKFLFRTISA